MRAPQGQSVSRCPSPARPAERSRRSSLTAPTLESLVARAETLFRDLDLAAVRRWKDAAPGRKAIGHMPIYVPRELVHAAGMLPVGLMGGGDQIEIIRGDAYFQSYICQIPRSTIEMGLAGRLDALDGMLFPAICDVIRNLSGMWRMLFPDRLALYVDLPQAGCPELAVDFYERELLRLAGELSSLSGVPVTDEALAASIALYDANAAAVRDLDLFRAATPWKSPIHETYLVLRAANLMEVGEHTRFVRDYLAAAAASDRPELDQSRVVVTGAFCEQPPLELLRTLERAGCYIVADDFVLGPRFIRGPVATGDPPFRALARAYVERGVSTASRYEPSRKKGDWLVETVRERAAEGVVFCAASFCDPALLEQPMLVAALERAGIPHTAFKYSENLGQFQVIREQAGTFSDSIRLWGAELPPQEAVP
ncbi:MAG: benzoyl-CoA reductase subunit C [Candidatus Wallbacteria bacterium]|nr:benzoyl-CoA reductase subunit C [Candidatus Wallbacteria bacterium]